MAAPLLGRTNLSFPPVWLSLTGSSQFVPGQVRDLCGAALASGSPIDVSSNPALWGSELRGHDYVAMAIGNRDLETAPDERAAASAVQAHLLQTLSALGRERIDFYFLRIRRAMEEVQLHGAFEAIEALRQDGHIRFLGLMVDGSPMAALGLLQFHDAFEVVLASRTPNDQVAWGIVEPLARERRVGMIGFGSRAFADEHTVLVPVRTAADIVSLGVLTS